MKQLDFAIKVAGGVGLLAQAIGVNNSHTISMWRNRGQVPAGWAQLLASMYPLAARNSRKVK